MMELFASGTVKLDQVNDALALVGISSLPQLALRPELIPQVAQQLGIAA